MNVPIAVLDICGKRTIEHVFEAVSYLNNNVKEIHLRAFGCNINKGVEVAQIIEEKFDIQIQKSVLGSVKLNNVKIPYLDIPIQFDGREIKDKSYGSNGGQNKSALLARDHFDYPLYHLLFDWHLKKNKRLDIKDNKGKILLTLTFEQEKIKYQRPYLNYKNDDERKKASRIDEALIRSGAAMPVNWKEISAKLSTHDDVILGIDTNILYNCFISEHLLPATTMIEATESVHTPNWILLVVPATVMYELEEAANFRYLDGNLKCEGRLAFRALQEIIELTDNIDIPGVSLLIVGEADANLDNKASLKRINENLYNLGTAVNELKNRFPETGTNNEKSFKTLFKGSPPRKSSSGDMTIRNQFKTFLRQIDFHKGTYFLTSDKSNAAMAMAEGLNPILIGLPFIDTNRMIPPITLKDENEPGKNEIRLDIQVGKVIYEMAVTFGEISICYKNNKIRIHPDQKGKNMENWIHKHLFIEKNDVNKLLKDYHGTLSLQFCADIWNKLVDRFEDIDWMPGKNNG